MKVKGTTTVDVDINLKQVLLEILSKKIGWHEYLENKGDKYYIQYSQYIENRGTEKSSVEITKDRYDALLALETLTHKFDYL